MCVCTYAYIYIYICIERERERDPFTHIAFRKLFRVQLLLLPGALASSSGRKLLMFILTCMCM